VSHIPDAAVEAAARAAFERWHPGRSWEASPELQEIFKREAILHLEAAAPHMLDEEGAVEFDRPAGYKLPEPIVLPDLSDDKVWDDLKKKAEQCERESRRTRRKYWLHQIFPWL